MLDPARTADAAEPLPADHRADAEGFEPRFELAQRRLLRIAGSLVGPDEAEDVVQDAYIQGQRHYLDLRDGEAFEAWMTRIVANLAYSRHRRRQLLRALLPRLARPGAAGRDIGLRELVERLPTRERTVLVLHYGHGYGLAEIADMLNLTHTNVRTIVARTRKRLFADWARAEGLDR